MFGTNQNSAAPIGQEPGTHVPFKTREPENFQCEIVETAGDIVRRKRLAKKGNWRRIDLDLGDAAQRALLQTDREYVLHVGRRVYAEAAAGTGSRFSELTQELLNTGRRAEFEKVGREGSVVLYSVRPVERGSSEIIVHYDESLGMPTKQEFFSLTDGQRVLQMTIEIVNFSAEPDAGAFAIPNGFRRVSVDEVGMESGK